MLFLTVALVHFIALITPGPDFFFISQVAVSKSRTETIFGVLGITLGIVVWAALALLGLNLLLSKMAWLEYLIKIAGGLYLCYLGYLMLKNARKNQNSTSDIGSLQGRSFARGFLTNLSNPKALIYFGSVFSLFLTPNVSSVERWGLFILISIETLVWFSLVAFFFSLPTINKIYRRATRWIDSIAGVLFIGFGIHLILSRRV